MFRDSSMPGPICVPGKVFSRAEFGGVSSGIHLLSFWGVDAAVFHPPPALPRILAHVVNAATPDPSREIEHPRPIEEPIPCAPIVRDGMLRLKGLFDVFEPYVPVACPCVFKASGWAQRSLSTKELLHVFDTPLDMDRLFVAYRRARTIMQRGITPIVVSSIFRALWSHVMGVDTASVTAHQGLTAHDEIEFKTGRKVEVDMTESKVEEDLNLTESKISWRSGWRCRAPIERLHSLGWTRWEAETGQLTSQEFTPPPPGWTQWEAKTGQLTAHEFTPP
jgi:hypothetical protein